MGKTENFDNNSDNEKELNLYNNDTEDNTTTDNTILEYNTTTNDNIEANMLINDCCDNKDCSIDNKECDGDFIEVISKCKHRKEFKCFSGCCRILYSPYKSKEYTDEYYLRPSRINKAGCFIYDIKKKKILLVQSHGKFFGSPKGSLNENESLTEGAIREVREETGIIFDKETLVNSFKINIKNTLYYVTPIDEVPVSPQTTVKDNDANAIGWIHIDCIKEMVRKKKIEINKHTKILLKKTYHINLN